MDSLNDGAVYPRRDPNAWGKSELPTNQIQIVVGLHVRCCRICGDQFREIAPKSLNEDHTKRIASRLRRSRYPRDALGSVQANGARKHRTVPSRIKSRRNG
ncbi:hypothetical protein QA640_08615 [Bradyrhizobium sp. CB82]|uniref:hypothetical protein n=1 Tax=Bradyrhizobium sp. CB82 TaxID=3039159 RepID=UPI0024B21BE3|nr:hypothetical protein [Bradyrhizobium sp. CB82]WFU42510.1 hypothetical protein QA640_08615 [Bradyrhizobium sp. CB82]